MMNMTRKDILERLLEFSVQVIRLAEDMPRTPAGRVVTNQLIRSGTSVGANVEEAQDAISRKEFVNKMSIGLREARETRYWIRIIGSSGLLKGKELDKMLTECKEICAILTTIVKKVRGSNE